MSSATEGKLFIVVFSVFASPFEPHPRFEIYTSLGGGDVTLRTRRVASPATVALPLDSLN